MTTELRIRAKRRNETHAYRLANVWYIATLGDR